MRERDALMAAKNFVQRNYADLADCYLEISLEQDGERCKSWSFGVHIDPEDPRYDQGSNMYTGYVHADGYVEGLY